MLDPLLPQHLSHWGIDIMRLEKTDKSLGEMELEMNMKHDWSKILDGDGEGALTPLSGAGLKGLRNLGSSCYLNSVMQVLLALPELQSRYLSLPRETLALAAAPTTDLTIQLHKLVTALHTGKYVEPPSAEPLTYTPEKYNVSPLMFKSLVGRGHREFSSSKQQDVSEFFQYFLEQLDREERTSLGRYRLAGPRTSSLFEFHIETRLQCERSNQVRYQSTGPQTLNNILELRIPLRDQREEADEQDPKKPRVEEVSFADCIDSYFQPSLVDFTHPDPALGPGRAIQSLAFSSFPRYLVVKLGRYLVTPDWKQVKIDAKVAAPMQLDLSALRGHGLQEREIPMSEGAVTPAAGVVADDTVVAQLVSMGFSENGARRAALATANDVEAAVNWVFEHSEDANFNDPMITSEAATPRTPASFNNDELLMLISFGYTRDQAVAAMTATEGNVDRAADWLFSHESDLQEAVQQVLVSVCISSISDHIMRV